MTQYISSDTNIWIDFAVIEGIDIPFRLDCVYLMYYESFDEEILSPEWAKSKLLELGLKCIDIEFTEYMLAGELIEKYKHKHLSKEDCIALAIAKTRNITLLTGDKHLREAAIAEKVQIIGTIGILDWVLNEKQISVAEYVHCLKILRDNPARRLPRRELDSRILKYSNED